MIYSWHKEVGEQNQCLNVRAQTFLHIQSLGSLPIHVLWAGGGEVKPGEQDVGTQSCYAADLHAKPLITAAFLCRLFR